MSNVFQFLSFAGLKRYNLLKKWGKSHPTKKLKPASESLSEATNSSKAETNTVFDPLMLDLFEIACATHVDNLTQTWQSIANDVALLKRKAILQRKLKSEAALLEQETLHMRNSIMTRLKDVDQIANQQLSTARLRTQISAVTQTRLSNKLQASFE